MTNLKNTYAYIQDHHILFSGFFQNEAEDDLLYLLPDRKSTEFFRLPPIERDLFERFAYLISMSNISALYPDGFVDSQLDIICAERMLFFSRSPKANDRFARTLLNAAILRHLLWTKSYSGNDGSKSEEHYLSELFGPIKDQIDDLKAQRAQIQSDEGSVLRGGALLLFIVAFTALVLNLFVPAAAAILTSESLKLLYCIILGAAVAVISGGFVLFALIALALLVSLMFNMFPLYASMKIVSVAATALVCLTSLALFRRLKKEYPPEISAQRRAELQKIRKEAKLIHRYTHKLIKTLQRKTPLEPDSFHINDPSELPKYRASLNDYCAKLREAVKEMDRHVFH